MEIIVGEIHSHINSKDPRALAIARKACRARPSGFQFMPKYKDGSWDGYISLMGNLYKFPTGLLEVVVSALESSGYKVFANWRDYPEIPYKVPGPDDLQGITLRDYQLEAIESLLWKRRGIAKMATNAGKTEVMAGILSAFSESYGVPKSMIVVHRKELLHQTAERLAKRLQRKVGIIGDGIHQPERTTVAMVQTLSSMFHGPLFNDWVSAYEILMVDECHHASSNQMMDVLYKIPGGYRYGFSATPLKQDLLSDMKLISLTGPVVIDVTNQDLIERGFSADPTIYLHDVISEDEDEWAKEYKDAYETQIVQNNKRNDLITSLARTAASFGAVVLVLVTRIDHGEILERKTEGVFVHGSHSTAHRKYVLSEMRKGIPGVYIASTIFDEGVDVPSVNTLILAGGGKSDLRVLQRVGRGLRQKDGENTLKVHDFIDETNKYLMKHSEDRIGVYVKEGFRIEKYTGETTIS